MYNYYVGINLSSILFEVPIRAHTEDDARWAISQLFNWVPTHIEYVERRDD